MKIESRLKILFLSIILIIGNVCLAQSVTINPNSSTAIIEAQSTTRGTLIPRMTVAERNSIPLSQGLQVYCTNCSPAGPYSYNGSAWLAMFQTTVISPITYTVGQSAQGGIVFWLDETAQHGLVVSNVDVSSGVVWYNGSTNTKALRSGVYGGISNTEQIIAGIGYGIYAAIVASSYFDSSGYGDWYLPSQGELVILLNSGLGILSGTYWSSTERVVNSGLIATQAWGLSSTGSQIISLKSTLNKVRAVRKF